MALMMATPNIGYHIYASESEIIQTMSNISVDALLKNMTLEQKVGQMIQADTRRITPEEVAKNYIGSILSGGGAGIDGSNDVESWAARSDEYQKAAIEGIKVDGVSIPLLYGVDAVHGHNNVDDATIFPHNINLGQTGNDELVGKIAEITAKEMLATGTNWTFTPTLGLPTNERWGRTYECYGEDADLSAELGSAYIEASQGENSFDPAVNVLATAKHFVGEGLATDGVNQGDIDKGILDAAIAQGDILKPYEEAIAAGVKTVMVTYNSVGGSKVHGSEEYISELLKADTDKGGLGFDGIVISDYNGIDQISEGADYAARVVIGVNAGIDMIMVDDWGEGAPSWQDTIAAIVDGVNDKKISEDRIDDAVTRILTVKQDMGILDAPTSVYVDKDSDGEYADETLVKEFGGDANRAVARQAVSESLVLLKNTATGGGSTLMSDLKNMDKLVVAGSSAHDIGLQCGGWTISWQGSAGDITEGTTILEGLREVGTGKTIDYKANGYFSATDYDAAIIVIGEDPYAEGEGDRTAEELKLKDSDIELIENIREDHPDLPIVAVLTVGRPLTIVDQLDYFDAIVMAGLPGTEGAGVADVLIGDQDFTGSLTYTWPWYALDIEDKLTDSSKVLFEYGRGLKKADTTAIQTSEPVNPGVITLGTTSTLEAEKFTKQSGGFQYEYADGTPMGVGYISTGGWLEYEVDVTEQGSYEVKTSAATGGNDSTNVAFDIYSDGVKIYSTDTSINGTGWWNIYSDSTMSGEISLPSGTQTLKVQFTKDGYNIDNFQFAKTANDYVPPVVSPDGNPEEQVGEGSLIQEEAVTVTMSSSEYSQSLNWYKGEYKISNKNSAKAPLDIRNADTTDVFAIQINDDIEYQPLLGMGISLEASTVYNLMQMDASTRTAFLTNLIDAESGMGNNFIRVTIGTSDFTSSDFYTYYDGTGTELNGKPDWYNTTGKGFSIQNDIDLGIIEVLQEVIQIGNQLGVDLKFFGSSWSPPGWMKNSTSASDSYPDNDLLLKGGTLADEHIDDLAMYYVRFVEEYKKQGIPIYAMTLQNEPLLEIDYPSCYITGKQEGYIAIAVDKAMENSVYLTEEEKDVKVWAFDHNFDGASSYVDDLFSVPGAIDHVDGIAFHPYGGVPSTMGSIYDQYSAEEDGGITMHLTERSIWGTSGANDIIEWFRNGAESYNAWVTMLDSNISPHHWVGTPDPTLFVKDADSQNGYWATPEVYITGQFSKYIKPGYVRIDSTNGSASTLTNVAFKDPETGEIVLVVANQSGADQNFKAVLDGTQFNASVPAGNVATYIWNPTETGDFKTITDDFTLEDATITGSGAITGDAITGIDATTKLSYNVNVPLTGTYKVAFDLAVTGNDSKDLQVVISQEEGEIGRTSIQKFDNASTYAKVQTYVTFENGGKQTIDLSFPDGGVNFKDITFVKEETDTISIPGYLGNDNTFYASGIINENFALDYIEADDYVDYKVVVPTVASFDTLVSAVVTANTTATVTAIPLADYAYGTTSASGTALGTITLTAEEVEHTGTLDFSSLTAGDVYILRVTANGAIDSLSSIVVGKSISISDCNLTEGSLNGAEFTVNLLNSTLKNGTPTKENWDINLPEGVDFSLTKDGESTVTVTLSGEAEKDFDIDQELQISILSDDELMAITREVLPEKAVAYFTIKAVDDEESLTTLSSVANGATSLVVDIVGGTFADDLDGKISLDENISKYIEITGIARTSATKATLTINQKAQIYAQPLTGTITVTADGYDDGDLPLSVTTSFENTNELPTAITVESASVDLSLGNSYRNDGDLSYDSPQGSYVDFYLDIKEAGDYVLSYDVATDGSGGSASNALKLSGGSGFATDNLGSISFGGFWGTVGYRNKLTLQQGEQTLRLEKNNAGFTLSNITITKLGNPTTIAGNGTASTVLVANLIDGSNEIAWAMENGMTSVGYQTVGSYQEYFVDVEKAGVYTFVLNAGSAAGGQPVVALKNVNGTSVVELGRTNVTKNGNWGSFQAAATMDVILQAGEQRLWVYTDGDGFNYDQFSLAYKGEVLATPTNFANTIDRETNEVTFTWSAVANATSYDLMQLVDGAWVNYESDITGTTVTIDDLVVGTTYVFGLLAKNESMISDINASPQLTVSIAQEDDSTGDGDTSTEWTYVASGSTIFATLDGEQVLLNLNAPEKTTYAFGENNAYLTLQKNWTAENGLEVVTNQDIVYEKMIDGEYATVNTVSGVGTYKASITVGGATATVSFNIVANSITNDSITIDGDFYYTDSEIKPEVEVVVAGKRLMIGTDFEVTYLDNTEVGTATIVITGIGNYAGTKLTKEFEILPLTPAVVIAKTTFDKAESEMTVDIRVQGIGNDVLKGTAVVTATPKLVEPVFEQVEVLQELETPQEDVEVSDETVENLVDAEVEEVEEVEVETEAEAEEVEMQEELHVDDSFVAEAEEAIEPASNTVVELMQAVAGTVTERDVAIVNGVGTAKLENIVDGVEYTITISYTDLTEDGNYVNTEMLDVTEMAYTTGLDDQATPSALELSAVLSQDATAYDVTATADSGAEYRFNTGTFSADSKIEGVSPTTVVNAYAYLPAVAYKKNASGVIANSLVTNRKLSQPVIVSDAKDDSLITTQTQFTISHYDTIDDAIATIFYSVDDGATYEEYKEGFTLEESDLTMGKAKILAYATANDGDYAMSTTAEAEFSVTVEGSTDDGAGDDGNPETPGGSPGGSSGGGGSNSVVAEKETVTKVEIPTTASGTIKATLQDVVVEVNAETGTTTKVCTYDNDIVVHQTITTDGLVSAEITGITGETILTIPLDYTPKMTEVAVIMNPDGTITIIKDSVIDGNGLRIFIDADVNISIIDNQKHFTDVVAGAWYAESVDFATARELFFGMSDTIFAPNGSMTRSMIWSVLYNYQGEDVGSDGTEWYAKAQKWASTFGISDGLYPDEYMTREQLVTLLYRLEDEPTTTNTAIGAFGDNTLVSDWASDGMNWAVAEGLLFGNNGNLNPKGDVSRAEVAAILMRYISQ